MDAVTHFLIPAFLVALYRDLFVKKKFSLHYVFLAGIGGLLPDFDIGVYFIMKILGLDVAYGQVHQVYTHIFLIPLVLFLLFLIFSLENFNVIVCSIRKHKLKLNYVFLVLGMGWLSHLFLDSVVGPIHPFEPFSSASFGLNYNFGSLFEATVDGVLFLLWMVYLEFKHKISDFI
ncbi:MAG: metal-dependent hydrolase [Nanoarchaeota archaeon]|nr:metal-dependent hydrolase [Nanoarchaeota archaeon]